MRVTQHVREQGPFGRLGPAGEPAGRVVMASSFATVQHERLDPQGWRTRDAVRAALFVHLETPQ